MKFIKVLPFNSEMDGDKLDCGLWQSDKNICEYGDQNIPSPDDTEGLCDNSGFYYGTTDEIEPKFCARHFYQLVVNGDGKGCYRLDK